MRLGGVIRREIVPSYWCPAPGTTLIRLVSRSPGRSTRPTETRRRRGLGLLDRSRIPEEARLGRGVLQGGGGTPRVRVPLRRAIEGPEDPGAGQEPARPGEGAGPVGDVPRRGARWPRLRTAQARSAQRGDRPLPLGTADVRRRRAGHREHGDARRLRHRRAEAAVARTAHEPGDVLRLLHDRAARGLGPATCSRPTPPATATSG